MCRGRNINESQYDPRENLNHEAEKRHTSEGVKPAGAAFRNRVAGGSLPDFDEVEPSLEPHRHVSQRVDDPFFLRTHNFTRDWPRWEGDRP